MRYLGFAFALLFAFFATHASATTFNTIQTFCTGTCTDGQDPTAPLLMDSSGVLYGTTKIGGVYGAGVVFSLTPSGSSYIYQDLHNFCSLVTSSVCNDGSTPVAGLIIDSSGNLYGTTNSGGANNAGLVFELVKPLSGPWTLVPIYSFCSVVGSSVCTDGQSPQSKLTYSGAESGIPYDGSSLLFGTTHAGGASSNVGTVYAIRYSGGVWSEKAILNFNNLNGAQPESGLVMDASTNVLWGTTQGGGSEHAGTAFKLTPGNHLWGSPWTETVIYNFCWALSNPCTDGRGPSGIVRDSSGNIYGAALDGGVGTSPGNGMIFKLTNGNCSENGVPGFWCNTALYNFCPTPPGTCSDGASPSLTSDLLMDSSGNLYGTTQFGGHTSNSGVVYELSGTTESVLHKFCTQSNCADGKLPLAGVILDSSGNLYGTASGGGSGSSGTVFQITP